MAKANKIKLPKVEALPSGTYRGTVIKDGKRYHVLGDSEEECIAKTIALRASLKKDTKLVENADITLREALDAYLKKNAVLLAPTTRCNYESYIRTRFQNYMDKPITKIDWQEAINAEAAQVSVKTVKNAWGLIRKMLHDDYEITPNVNLPRVKKQASKKEFLRPNQIPVFIEALHGKSFEIPALLGLHSLRRSEILGLTWDCIDLKEGSITIKQTLTYDKEYNFALRDETKTAASNRKIPIFIPELKAALEAIPEEDRNGRIVTTNPTTLYSQVNDLCKRNGLPEIGVHGLRHTFASLGYHLNLKEKAVMKLGGWSDLGTIRNIYTHLAEEDEISDVETIKTFFNRSL